MARQQLKLIANDETVDTIRPGDLLTVLEELEDAYVVVTFRGKRGVVSKAYAAKLEEAVEIYDRLIAKDSQESRLHTLRANAWWARGSIERALADFNKAVELGREDPDGYCHRGLCHAALANYEAAIRDYSVAIEIDPDFEAAYINRAAAYMVQRSFAAALRDYSEAIGLNGGQRASTYEQRAVAWKQVGIRDKALADFGRALALHPESVTALMGRGFLWFETNRHRRAVIDFSRVIKIDPGHAQAYNNRGFNYRLLGYYRRALADFERALRIDPAYALAHQNHAWLLAAAPDAKLRDGKRAVQAATQACELNGYKDPGDLKSLAASFAELGEFDKAVGWHEKAVAMLPEADRIHEEQIAKRYREQKPFRLSAEKDAESSPDSGQVQESDRAPVELTLINGSETTSVHICLGEATATGKSPRDAHKVELAANEEKLVKCDRVLCYYTGLKWKNVYVLEDGLLTFSVQKLGRDRAQWVDAYEPADSEKP